MTTKACSTNMTPYNLLSNTGQCLIEGSNTIQYSIGEPVTVSKLLFMHRLYEQIGTLFDPPFKWDNIFLAGGLISGLLEVKYNPELYKDSDLDMYICSISLTDLCTRMMYVLNYIREHTKNCYFLISGTQRVCLIDCIIEGFPRRLQLIGLCGTNLAGLFNINTKDKIKSVKCPSPSDVMSTFDMTHCQVAYDGNDLICTPEFIDCMITHHTVLNPQVQSIHAYRLVKAHLRGYSIMLPKHQVYIKNFFHRYGVVDDPSKDEVARIPSLTDHVWEISNLKDQFPELLKNSIVQQNLHKNFMIDFTQSSAEQLNTIVGLNNWAGEWSIYDRSGKIVCFKSKDSDFLPQRNSLQKAVEAMTITNILTR
jgi:hypothetical protein